MGSPVRRSAGFKSQIKHHSPNIYRHSLLLLVLYTFPFFIILSGDLCLAFHQNTENQFKQPLLVSNQWHKRGKPFHKQTVHSLCAYTRMNQWKDLHPPSSTLWNNAVLEDFVSYMLRSDVSCVVTYIWDLILSHLLSSACKAVNKHEVQ